MYLSLFFLVFAVIYIFYLRRKKGELKELQKTITLLQEQTLLISGVEKRIYKLKKAGIKITGLDGVTSILSRAYFRGWYRFSKEQREEIHSIREKVESKFPWL